MTKKSKTTQQAPERVPYRFEVVDWRILSRIAICPSEKKDPTEAPLDETNKLVLMCKLISPEIKGIEQVQINLFLEPKMEQSPYKPEDEAFLKVIGGMLIEDANVLALGCQIPPRMAILVQGAAAADKVNHVLVYGSRLKNRHALIYHISLSSTLILDTT